MNKVRSQEVLLDGLLSLRNEIERVRGIERKQASEILMLKEKESLYRELFNRSNDGIAIIQESILKEVNPTLFRMLKWPKAKLRNRCYTDFLSSDSLITGKDLYERRQRGEDVTSVFETIIVDRRSKQVPVEINAGLTTYDGEAADLLIVRDLTYFKKAEAEILRLKQYEESFLDNINIWLEVYDNRENVVIWNKAAEEISGYSKEEIVGRRKNLELLYHDLDRRREVVRKLRGGISTGPGETSFETEILCKDGRKRTLSWYSRSILNGDAKVTGRIVLGIDITARIQAEATLAKSKETMDSLLNAISESIYLVNPKGLILASNAITARRWKKEGQELAGRIVFDMLSEGPAAALRSEIRQVMQTGAPVRYEDSEDGRNFDTTIYPIFGNEGRIEQMAVFTADITEKKMAEDALQLQNNLLEEKNVALREMIRQVGDEKKLIGEKVKANIDRLLLPLVGNLKAKGGRLDDVCVNLLENGLKELTDSFGLELDARSLDLTQREIEIAHMIKNGVTSKQIAQILGISPRTVEIHRGQIRKKLGLTRRRQNLQAFLRNLSLS